MTSPLTLYSVRLFAGGADLTGQSNTVTLDADVEEHDVTTFLPEDDPDLGWKKVAGGKKTVILAAQGLWAAGDAGMVDDHHFANMGSHVPFTIGRTGAAVGDKAFLTQALRTQYKLGGEVAQPHPWMAGASGAGVASSGVILHPPGTARTSSADGTAVEFLAVSASQTLYANLHVLSVSGTNPTLDVIIESDADADFDGSETTRITFDEASSISGQSKSLAGAITDTWYRASWTIGGTDTPSFMFVVSVGIK